MSTLYRRIPVAAPIDPPYFVLSDLVQHNYHWTSFWSKKGFLLLIIDGKGIIYRRKIELSHTKVCIVPDTGILYLADTAINIWRCVHYKGTHTAAIPRGNVWSSILWNAMTSLGENKVI